MSSQLVIYKLGSWLIFTPLYVFIQFPKFGAGIRHQTLSTDDIDVYTCRRFVGFERLKSQNISPL